MHSKSQPLATELHTTDFFKLRQHLKVLIDFDISEEFRKVERFGKIRPFMNQMLNVCLPQTPLEFVSIDGQMIPFTGAFPFRQYVPSKPNPVGIKNFVFASADGIVLDL